MIKKIQKNMNKKGFTLVELIIVIAVMAILAAIAIPRMTGITTTFKQNADVRACENYAHEIQTLVQLGKITAAASGEITGAVLQNTGQTIPGAESVENGKFYYSYNTTDEAVYVSVLDSTGTKDTATIEAAAKVDTTGTSIVDVVNIN